MSLRLIQQSQDKKHIRELVRKEKEAKEYPGTWHGRVDNGTGRAKLMTWGRCIFVLNLCIFQPESALNPLSFAPRLNL